MATLLHLVMPRGRVGSNLLTSILNRSKSIQMNNEVLTSIRTKYSNFPDDISKCENEQISFLQQFTNDTSNSDLPNIKYAGLKTDLISVVNITDFFFNEIPKSAKLIYLYRKNFIKQAVSLIRAERNAERMQAKYGSRLWGIKSTADILPPEDIDPQLILMHAEKMAMSHHMASVYIGLLSIDKMVLTYEDINRDLAGTVRRIEDFLQLRLEAETQFVKATPDKLRDAVANYAEICRFFADTRFSKYILCDS